MTPAEWLAVVFLVSFTLSTAWEIFEPDSLVLTFNSNMRLALAVLTQIAVIVLSLMVLSAGLAFVAAVSTLFCLSIGVSVSRHF